MPAIIAGICKVHKGSWVGGGSCICSCCNANLTVNPSACFQPRHPFPLLADLGTSFTHPIIHPHECLSQPLSLASPCTSTGRVEGVANRKQSSKAVVSGTARWVKKGDSGHLRRQAGRQASEQMPWSLRHSKAPVCAPLGIGVTGSAICKLNQPEVVQARQKCISA